MTYVSGWIDGHELFRLGQALRERPPFIERADLVVGALHEDRNVAHAGWEAGGDHAARAPIF